jgi:trans-aconitate methyltransferase
MKRIPEEELMGLPLRVRAYAGADFSEPNSKFVASFTERFPEFDGERVADLGCGPGDITIRFAARYPAARIVGFDGADAMLDIARHAILLHALTDRIEFKNGI